MLITSAVTPTAGASTPDKTDFTEVATHANYTAGGTSIGAFNALFSQSGGVTTFDSGTNPSWTKHASGNSARWGLIYNDDDTDRCYAFVDLGSDRDMSEGDLTVTWNGSGLFTIS